MVDRAIAIDASRASGSAKTGTEWYSHEIIRTLVHRDDRPPLSLYHRSSHEPSFDGPRVRHVHIQQRRLWTHVGLSRAMRRDPPAALFIPSHVIPLIHPPASVATIHDLGYLVEPNAHPASTRRILDLTTRWNARVARQIIAISGQTRDDLVERYRTDRSKITVVYSGVDRERFRPLNHLAVGAATRKLGIDRPYLFFLSTVQPRKNVIRLIEAFERLGDDDLLLVLAGASGWLSEPIERRINESPAAPRIRRLGHIADNDVPALYNGAAAFALPSLYEGFGMGIIEAMACDCPVVTSDRSSMPEVAGGAAILVDPFDIGSIRDGIARALQPSERDRLIAAGRERVQQFTWEHTASETLAVIRRAIDGS